MARRRRSRHVNEEISLPPDFKNYDLVWVKMRGYPLWPAQIRPPVKRIFKKNMRLVHFYGTHDFAWMYEKNIFSYEDYYGTASRPGAPLKSYASASLQISRACHRRRLSKNGLKGIKEFEEIAKKRVKYPLLDNGEEDYVLPRVKRVKKEKSKEKTIKTVKRAKGKCRSIKKCQSGYSCGTVHVQNYKEVIHSELQVQLERCDENEMLKEQYRFALERKRWTS
ncbi:hypothetical protein NPIL_231481 [Nephila pilipes]|uniref:PWWP domain-containing protein n=1 Tax=Nephila pilipes TaxID=299642 RepID=A0A8X6PDZ1_NEPPI|nr:hypothetical protein NPIL_231481 [Nephila pilipes]